MEIIHIYEPPKYFNILPTTITQLYIRKYFIFCQENKSAQF